MESRVTNYLKNNAAERLGELFDEKKLDKGNIDKLTEMIGLSMGFAEHTGNEDINTLFSKADNEAKRIKEERRVGRK